MRQWLPVGVGRPAGAGVARPAVALPMGLLPDSRTPGLPDSGTGLPEWHSPNGVARPAVVRE
jgi:hypothetical protein